MEIKVKISNEAIWGNVDAEAEGLNQYESEMALVEIITGYIADEYKDADVEVLTAFTDTVFVDGDDEHAGNKNAEVAANVTKLIDKAWNGNWEVCA